MKIVVMGTGPFAVPTFRWMVESEHEVSLVVTRPIDDAGRRRKTVANPAREFAESQGLPIFAPQNINDQAAVEFLETQAADLLFVCDFGQILKPDALSSARLGGINLHGSLLPKYRGAAPINWAIYHGETVTGVTVIHMTPRLDGGPALSQKSIDIGPDETAEQLEPRLAELGVSSVADSIEQLKRWDGNSIIGELQNPKLVSKAPRLQKKQGDIDWNQSAHQLFNQVRAFQPWPGSFTHWIPMDGKPLRLIVHRVSFVDSTLTDQPGTVIECQSTHIAIATGNGCLRIHEIQPAGKKPMPVQEFLRGRKVIPGDCFGHPAN